MDVEKTSETTETEEMQLPAKEVLQEFPHERFNAQLTVQVSEDLFYPLKSYLLSSTSFLDKRTQIKKVLISVFLAG